MTELDPAVVATRVAVAAVHEAAFREPDIDVKIHLAVLAQFLYERPPFHVIDVTEDGWTIMHPLIGCGTDLFDCPVTDAEVDVEMPGRYGRFRCDVDQDGQLVIGDELPAGNATAAAGPGMDEKQGDRP